MTIKKAAKAIHSGQKETWFPLLFSLEKTYIASLGSDSCDILV